MNIFFLSFSPETAAQSLCDKHVPKMVLETAQLLCSPFEPGTAPYKRTHWRHPCAEWVRKDPRNYIWLLAYGKALSSEYTRRFGKVHKSESVIDWCYQNHASLWGDLSQKYSEYTQVYKAQNWRRLITPVAQAMPAQYRHYNAATAYRKYYIGEKTRFAKWERGRKPPKWWPKEKT